MAPPAWNAGLQTGTRGAPLRDVCRVSDGLVLHLDAIPESENHIRRHIRDAR